MDIKKIFKKIVEILLIVILCVAVTRFFINKEQKQKRIRQFLRKAPGKKNPIKIMLNIKIIKNQTKKRKKNIILKRITIIKIPIRKKPFHQGTENIK